MRAGGFKSASRARTTEGREQRRNRELIKANKSAKKSGAICSKDTKQDRSAAVDAAVLFYLREFRGLSQAATLRKREAFCRHTGSGTTKVFRPAGAGRKTPQIIRYRRSMEKETF